MTPEAEDDLEAYISFLKQRGDSAEESLRAAEIWCGKSRVEFYDGGREVVETIYDGKFSTRPGGLLGFDPNPPAAPVPATTTVTPPAPIASTSTAEKTEE